MPSKTNSKKQPFWLLYAALIISGALLIADALHIAQISRLTIRLGIGLLFTAVSLIAGKNQPVAIISIALIWIAVIITFFN